MSDLRGRAAVVTGVSRRNGIGFAVAQRLLAAGTEVLIHSWAADDENPDSGGLEAVLTELQQVGRPVAHVEADFGDPESRRRSSAQRTRPSVMSTSSSSTTP